VFSVIGKFELLKAFPKKTKEPKREMPSKVMTKTDMFAKFK
jgi:hypothetical protein